MTSPRLAYTQAIKATNHSRNKFGAVPTMLDGIRFASKAEADCFARLKLREKAKEITHLTAHPKWQFVVNGQLVGTYTADMSFMDKGRSALRVVDVKSPSTAKLEAFKIKRWLMFALYGIDVEIWPSGREPTRAAA